MNLSEGNKLQIIVFCKFLHIRLMLKEIGIDGAVSQCFIGQNVIGEFNDLKVNAFFLKFGLYLL